jgi:hypothetical protein
MAEDNKKSGDGGSDEEQSTASEAPEVEAEIVTEGDLAESAADISDGFSDEDGLPSPQQKKSILTPGVILFIIFMVFALSVLAIWRLQTGNAPKTPHEQQPDAIAVPDVGVIGTETPHEATDDVGRDIETPIAPPPDQAEAAPAGRSKISNQMAEDAKAVDLEPAPTADGTFLPPLPSTDDADNDNLSFQESAKEAFRQAGPLNDDQEVSEARLNEEQGDALSGSIGYAPAFEIEDAVEPMQNGPLPENGEPEGAIGAAAEDIVGLEGAQAEKLVETTDIAPKSVGPETTAPEIMPGQNISKLNNEIESIKDLLRAEIASLETTLAEERQRNVAQRADIEAMRREFQAALEARDKWANAEIAALTNRMDKIQNDDGIAAGRRAVATIALSALQRAAASGEPYSAELNLLAGFAPNASEITVLRRYADIGAPTVNMLQQEFGAVARKALSTSGREEATGFFGKLSARAGGLISVRPAEPTAGAGVQAIISRAEDHIEKGEISAGVSELEALPESARVAMGKWLELAAARANVDDAIAALSNRLTAPSKQG